MSATIIKNGTVVTADLSYKADVRIEGGKITEIGANLTGGTVLDATGCYVMPGGIDPHTHLEMPFMGTTAAETWESGTYAALSGGTTMVVGPSSRLDVKEFHFDATTQDGGLLVSLLRGSMRMITGLIGKKQPDAVRVETQTATIGIRGTDFIVQADAQP